MEYEGSIVLIVSSNDCVLEYLGLDDMLLMVWFVNVVKQDENWKWMWRTCLMVLFLNHTGRICVYSRQILPTK